MHDGLVMVLAILMEEGRRAGPLQIGQAAATATGEDR